MLSSNIPRSKIFFAPFNRAISFFSVRMSLPVQRCINRFTRNANTSSFSVNVAINKKIMASTATLFSAINCRISDAAKNINTWSNRFKMIRIDTDFISTKMVNMKSFWNRAFENFIRNAMRKIRFFGTAYPKLTVSSSQNRRFPYPARFSFVYFFQETLKQGFSFCHIVPLNFCPVSTIEGDIWQ